MSPSAAVSARRLTDADRPALLELLAPIETKCVFLVGNAIQHGLDDRGGSLHGRWVGAFDGDRLVGVAAGALALYESMGFVREAPWVMAFVEAA